MKYLSVCSGIEAASVAWDGLGWKPLAFSEIEPFPRAVLAHHYPDVPLHGDFTELRHLPFIEDADLLCGGTPCQSFSVAGLRESLSDDRGNLTLQFIKLANAIDHLRSTAGREPCWVLYENVPGLFSTHDNAFGSFLGGLCGRDAPIPEPAGGWTSAGVVDGPTRVAAWRVLDAQHLGLAQRRKRVFVLARGGAGRWAAADALLPIIESGRWHPAPSRGKGERVAGKAAGSAGVGVEGVDYENNPVWAGEPMGPLMKGSPTGGGRPLPVVMATGQASAMSAPSVDMAPTLSCNHEAPILIRMREGKEGGGKGPLVSEDMSLTLATANDQVLAFHENQRAEISTSDTVGSLNSGGGKPGQGYSAVFAFKAGQGAKAGSIGGSEHLAPTLGAAQSGSNLAPSLMQGMQVRRLTPRECERLQGFPDGYTDIPWRGKDHAPDGPRYKAIGNSWAVPCARWIGERIEAVTNPTP